MDDPPALNRTVKLNLAQGLHIRACSKVVAIVGSFAGKIQIRYGDKSADASSMFDLVQLAALPGSDLVLEATGDGAEAILDKLESIFSQPSDDP